MKRTFRSLCIVFIAAAAASACRSEPAPAAAPASSAAPAPAPAPGAATPVERETPKSPSPASALAPASAPPARSSTPSPAVKEAPVNTAAPASPAATAPAADKTAAPPVPEAAPAPPPPPPPPPPREATLRTGRALSVYTSSALSTKSNQTGEKFVGTLAEAIAEDGWVIAKRGARVEGVIVESDPGARVKGLASITVSLESVTLADGRTVKLDTSAYRREANSSKGKDAKKIGVATGVGAAIGAIAGGGKGAAIGAGVGGGAGTGAVLATRGDPAVIPAETRIRFTLESPVTIVEQRTPDR